MFCAGVALTTVLGIEFRLEAREQLDDMAVSYICTLLPEIILNCMQFL
jgi:hypothetical protein